MYEDENNPFSAPRADLSEPAQARPGRFSLDDNDRRVVGFAGAGAVGMGIYFFLLAGLYTLVLVLTVVLSGGAAIPMLVLPVIMVTLFWVLGSKFARGGRAFRHVLTAGDETGKLVRAFDEIGQAFAIMAALILSSFAILLLIFGFAFLASR